MRSGRLKRAKRKLSRATWLRFAALFLSVTLVIALFAVYFNRRVRPVMRELIVSKISNYAFVYIADAVSNELSGGLEYSDLVTLVKNSQGDVTAIITDMAGVNLLQSRLAMTVTELSDLDESIEVKIPLGTIIGINLASGLGPELPFRAILGSDVEIDLISSLSAAGINQTCHRILAEVTVSYKVFIPGEWLVSEAVSRIVLAETVIVGDVPQSYARFGNDYESEDRAFEYYLTNSATN